MGGVIIFKPGNDPGHSWFAAGWLYREVVGNIVKHGADLSPAVLERLKLSIDPQSMECLDLSDLTAPDLRRVRAAADAAFQTQLKERGAGWNSPEFWPVYETHFRELLSLMDRDARIADPDSHILDEWREVLENACFVVQGDRNTIAVSNMILFSTREQARTRIEPARLADFINDAYDRYRAGLPERTEEYWFYAWCDDQVDQLRCSAAPAKSEKELPFASVIQVVRDPLPVAGDYLERKDRPPLIVFGRPIPW